MAASKMQRTPPTTANPDWTPGWLRRVGGFFSAWLGLHEGCACRTFDEPPDALDPKLETRNQKPIKPTAAPPGTCSRPGPARKNA